MAPPTERKEILSRFRANIEKNVPIMGAGAGTIGTWHSNSLSQYSHTQIQALVSQQKVQKQEE